MLREKMWPIYRKLSIIGILCFCVYIFGYSDGVQPSFAARPCIQFCENNSNECNANCEEECSEESSDPACETCLSSCSQTYFQCLSYAIFCSTEVVNPARCDVNFGAHCPIINGMPDCTQSHQGYSLTCTSPIGGFQCINCPSGEYCAGEGGLPPCLY
jgi:hypothetical protein